MFKGSAAGGSKAVGDDAESRALAWRRARGQALVERNYRVARGPLARAGKVALILRDRDGTLVFVEVRTRAAAGFGASSTPPGLTCSATPRRRRRAAST